MKSTAIVISILCISCLHVSARCEELPYRGVDLYFETAYVIPTREALRTNYDRTLFVGSTRAVPLSIGLGGQYFISTTSAIYFDVRWSRNELRTVSDKVSIAVTPVGVGYRFYFIDGLVLRASASAGPCLYWVATSTSYTSRYVKRVTLELVTEERAIDKSHLGFGVNLGSSIEFCLSRTSSLGVATSIDINKIGSVENGGLGNLGSLWIGLRFVYCILC
jgi:hypothetical protein